MITTRWTFGSFEAARKTETVPATAGLIKSSGFSTFQWNGEAVWMIALGRQPFGPQTAPGLLDAYGRLVKRVLLLC